MHSHTSIQFLVKRAEEFAQRRAKKDRKPLWLNHFIEDTADLFEPETETARVGFESHFNEEHWRVHFYLGDAEFIGGMLDGKRQRIAFDFDLKQLLDSFEVVESLRNRLVACEGQTDEECTMIEVTGLLHSHFGGERLVVGILSRPPLEAGPGVRIYQDGSIEPV